MARGRKPGAKNSAEPAAKPASAFEATLWATADKLRGNMDASEYKHVALGLIFLKYISDRFEERRAQALADPEEAGLVDERDLYVGDNVFWVPERARWDFLKANATGTDPTIGALIDQAMIDLETENPSLKGVLTKNYARPELDQDQARRGHQALLRPDVPGRASRPGYAGARLRIFSRPVRHRRGQARRAILHGRMRRAPVGRDDPALQRPGLRPLLRFRRNVCAVGTVRRGTQW